MSSGQDIYKRHGVCFEVILWYTYEHMNTNVSSHLVMDCSTPLSTHNEFMINLLAKWTMDLVNSTIEITLINTN